MKKLKYNLEKEKMKDSGSTGRFGYEWSKYSRIIPQYELQFLKWVYPLKPKDFKGKKILDAGCGIGRNSYWPLKYGAKEVVSFDYDLRTVNSAKKNLSPFKNSKVFLGSIYNIPYKNYFDISFSIGVVHHIENPSLAIENLIESARKGGKILIWVYGYEGNEWIVKYINPIRKISSRLPPKVTHKLAYLFSIPLFLYLKIFKQKKRYLKLISKLSFKPVHLIVFDQLIPKIANYWKKEEVLNLFNNSKIKDIKIFQVNNISWTIMGIKK